MNGSGHPENLSVPGRNLEIMSTFNETDTSNQQAHDVFADPVAFLAKYGIEATLVAETTLPVAA